MCFLKSFCKHRTYIFKYRLRTYLANWYYLCLYAEVLPRKKAREKTRFCVLMIWFYCFLCQHLKVCMLGQEGGRFLAKFLWPSFYFMYINLQARRSILGPAGICSHLLLANTLVLFYSRSRLVIQHRAAGMSKILVGTSLFVL